MVLDQYANTASAGSLIAFNLHHEDLDAGDLGVICSLAQAIQSAVLCSESCNPFKASC